MATLQIRVKIDKGAVVEVAPKLAGTDIEKSMIVCFGGAPGGNLPKRYAQSGPAYDPNNPTIAGAISVSYAGRVTFDSSNFTDNLSLAQQVAEAIDSGKVVVENTAAPGVPLLSSAILAFV